MNKDVVKRLGEVLLVILSFYFLKKEALFIGIISYFVFRVIYSFSMNIDFKEMFSSLNKEKRWNYFLYSIGFCLLIGVGTGIVLTILSLLFKSIMGIKNIETYFLLIVGVIVINLIMKLFSDYLSFNRNEKFSNNIMKLYKYGSYGLVFILFIIMGICRVNSYTFIAILYVPFIVMGIVMLIIMGKKIKWIGKVKFDKGCINKFKITINKSFEKGLVSSYIYGLFFMGVSILYGLLSLRYGYTRGEVINNICDVYLFYLVFVGLFIELTCNNLGSGIKGFYDNFKKSLLFGSLFMYIMDVVIYMVYGNNVNFGLLFYLSLFMISISNFRCIYRKFSNGYGIKAKKIMYISIFSGTLIKVILTFPLMKSFIRMGQSAIYGDILSSIVALIFGNIVGLIYIVIRERVNLNELTINIINSLYKCIIMCVIFILIRMCIPLSSNKFVLFMETILYLVLAFAFYRVGEKVIKE